MLLQPRRRINGVGIDARLRRLESVTRAQRAAREDARFSAAVRLLSDADLTGLVEWMDTPEGQGSFDAPPGHAGMTGAGPEPPAHLWAAWQSAWEQAGEPGGAEKTNEEARAR